MIRSMLEGTKHRTVPWNVDLYEILYAVLYLLKADVLGVRFQAIFPGWNIVAITLITGQA